MLPFRTFGFIAITFGIVGLLVVAANLVRGSLGGHSLTALAGPSLLSIFIGIELLLRRKWAAIVFAAILGSTGLWMGIMSVMRVPMPWLIVNVGFACILLVPSAIVARGWSQLDHK